MAGERAAAYKERVAHGTAVFPLGFYEAFPDVPWDGVSHHWHEEIELLYFTAGQGELEINMERYPFAAGGKNGGALFFVNSGELHAIAGGGRYRESAVLFHPRMLSFDSGDAAQTGLLAPLRAGELALPHRLEPTSPVFAAVEGAYLSLAAVCRRGASAMADQLLIKAELLKILALLAEAGLLTRAAPEDDNKVLAVKTALAYLRAHYPEKLHVRDLAAQVNLNEQYFCRFFRRALGQSPMAYLNEYRLRKAAELLRGSELSVTEISLRCGFYNLGNFLRAFRQYTGQTPLKYRQSAGVKKS